MSTKDFAATTITVVAVNVAAGVMYGMYKTLRDRHSARKVEQNLVTD